MTAETVLLLDGDGTRAAELGLLLNFLGYGQVQPVVPGHNQES